jgi:hypothetical protein
VTDLLVAIHPWLGYLVALVVLVAAFSAFGRAKDAREYTPGPFAAPMVLLDVQVLLGIVIYLLDAAWQSRIELAVVHPVLALAALGVGHAALKRARDERMAVDAHRKAGRGLVAALFLVLLSIVVALAPPFL